MIPGAHGLEPAGDLAMRFEQALNDIPGSRDQLNAVHWNFVEHQPLLDSANMQPADWESIANTCIGLLDADALIIIHGTDTMAYTASALAYLLGPISIPVLITGAQKPLSEKGSDALGNLLGAMIQARNLSVTQSLHSVWVYFHQRLLPATRVVKKSALDFDGFDAPRTGRDSAPPSPPLKLHSASPARAWNDIRIVTVVMQPWYPAIQLRALTGTRPQAIILALYGLGTLADMNHDLLSALEEAQHQGIILIAISQCYIGSIDFDIYATGRKLAQLGILSGEDITLEAAYTKLLVLFRRGYSTDEIKQLFVRPIANDMSTSNTL